MGWLDRLRKKPEKAAGAEAASAEAPEETAETPPRGDALYRAVEYAAVPLPFGEEVVLAPGRDRRAVLTAEEALLLRGAHPFRTLDEHAELLCERIGGDVDAARAVLDSLVERGWLA